MGADGFMMGAFGSGTGADGFMVCADGYPWARTATNGRGLLCMDDMWRGRVSTGADGFFFARTGRNGCEGTSEIYSEPVACFVFLKQDIGWVTSKGSPCAASNLLQFSLSFSLRFSIQNQGHVG